MNVRKYKYQMKQTQQTLIILLMSDKLFIAPCYFSKTVSFVCCIALVLF
jgi:hypothetical protein